MGFFLQDRQTRRVCSTKLLPCKALSTEALNAVFKVFGMTRLENKAHVYRLQSGGSNHYLTDPSIVISCALKIDIAKYSINFFVLLLNVAMIRSFGWRKVSESRCFLLLKNVYTLRKRSMVGVLLRLLFIITVIDAKKTNQSLYLEFKQDLQRLENFNNFTR